MKRLVVGSNPTGPTLVSQKCETFVFNGCLGAIGSVIEQGVLVPLGSMGHKRRSHKQMTF